MTKRPTFILYSRVTTQWQFGIFLLTAIAMLFAPPFARCQGQQPATRDILFSERGTNKLFLDIYTPRFAPPPAALPLIVIIRASWQGGDRHWGVAFHQLTERGLRLSQH